MVVGACVGFCVVGAAVVGACVGFCVVGAAVVGACVGFCVVGAAVVGCGTVPFVTSVAGTTTGVGTRVEATNLVPPVYSHDCAFSLGLCPPEAGNCWLLPLPLTMK